MPPIDHPDESKIMKGTVLPLHLSTRASTARTPSTGGSDRSVGYLDSRASQQCAAGHVPPLNRHKHGHYAGSSLSCPTLPTFQQQQQLPLLVPLPLLPHSAARRLPPHS